MVGDFKTTFLRNLDLALLDFLIEEFLDLAAIQADQMVVVRTFVQLEHRLAGFEVIALQQAGLLKLRQHAIDRGQADIQVVIQQNTVHVLGAQMTHFGIVEDVENLQTGQRRFEAAGFQLGRIVRHVSCSDKDDLLYHIVFSINCSIRLEPFMQMLPLHSRLPAGGVLCVALAMFLGGCASKNPLMEEPTPVASKTKPAAAPQVASTQAAPAEEAKPATAALEPAPASTAAAEAAPSPAPVAAAAPLQQAGTAQPTGGVHVEHKKRFLGIFSPYRPDIQQGNFVSQEMVAQLKEGMTPDQVIFLMGTPLLNDVFHGERWDYPFRMQKGNGEITTSHVTVYFENNRVSRIEGGGELPTEADYLARIANKAKQKK